MSVEKDMRTYILTRTAITDIIGTRVYSQKLPQNPTLPALVYSRISTVRRRSHDGDSSLTRPRIQYSCWATTTEAVEDLADTFEDEFKSFSGTAGSSNIYATIVENRISLLDEDSKLYHIPLDLMIQYDG